MESNCVIYCEYCGRTFLSVMTQTFLTPRFSRSIPTSCVTPSPKRMFELAISNAYSLSAPPTEWAELWRRPDAEAVGEAGDGYKGGKGGEEGVGEDRVWVR